MLLILSSLGVVSYVGLKVYSTYKPQILLYFQGTTRVEISHKVIDIGKVPAHQPAEAVFEIVNIGTSNLYIKQVEADCHCTLAEWEKGPIKAGGKTEIKAVYDKHTVGYYQQFITVHTNTENSPIVLIFKGNIETIPFLN